MSIMILMLFGFAYYRVSVTLKEGSIAIGLMPSSIMPKEINLHFCISHLVDMTNYFIDVSAHWYFLI